jgi:hypothetical protein
VALPAAQRNNAVDTWLGGSDAAAVKSLVSKLSGTELGSLASA